MAARPARLARHGADASALRSALRRRRRRRRLGWRRRVAVRFVTICPIAADLPRHLGLAALDAAPGRPASRPSATAAATVAALGGAAAGARAGIVLRALLSVRLRL